MFPSHDPPGEDPDPFESPQPWPDDNPGPSEQTEALPKDAEAPETPVPQDPLPNRVPGGGSISQTTPRRTGFPLPEPEEQLDIELSVDPRGLRFKISRGKPKHSRENRRARDKKQHNSTLYRAGLKLINKTYGQADEVIDWTEILLNNLYIPPNTAITVNNRVRIMILDRDWETFVRHQPFLI